MTFARWGAAVTAACGAIAIVLLPFPAPAERSWVPVPPAPLALEMDRLSAAVGDAHAAVHRYRAAQALDRWSVARASAPDTMSIRLDASVPSSIARAVRANARAQWARLGRGASASHAELFVYVDTTSLPRTREAAAPRRVLEPRRLIDVSFALPGATGTDRCVALVRLRGTTPAHVDALRNRSLTGVCAFFAAFGMPGQHVGGWLAATGYASARQSDWDVPRAPAVDRAAVYALSATGHRCLTGEAGSCASALRADSSVQSAAVTDRVDPLASVLSDGPSPRAGSMRTLRLEARLGDAESRLLGDAESRLLADAVRELGHERFAGFWRSAAAPDIAFAAAAGTSMDEWARRWLVRTYGAVPERPVVRAAHLVWLVAAAPVLLLVAARPRDRVLSEAALR